MLKATVAGEVRADRLSRALYSTDASVYQIVPVAVVLPRSEADVVATVRACRRYGVPLTARGGGTSQAGQSIGPGVILDCSKYFNRVLEINPAERWARVEPGCVLDDLNRAVRPHNLQFAPDISTSSRATIGGMVANNSSGTRSVYYGKTIDHVAELKVVLADGTSARLGPLERRRARSPLPPGGPGRGGATGSPGSSPPSTPPRSRGGSPGSSAGSAATTSTPLSPAGRRSGATTGSTWRICSSARRGRSR